MLRILRIFDSSVYIQYSQLHHHSSLKTAAENRLYREDTHICIHVSTHTNIHIYHHT